MPPNVKDSKGATMKGNVEGTTTKEEDPIKNKISRVSLSKSKVAPKKKAKNDAIELDNLEGEEEVPIEWRDDEIKPSLRYVVR